MSEKTRAKRAKKAATLLPPGTTIRTYALGRGHWRAATPMAIGLIAVFAVGFAVALALGYVLIPGGLLLLVVVNECRPGRDVVVTDQGLALLHRSVWNSKPSKVVALLPLAPLYAPSPSGSVTLELGPERITLPRKEFDRLVAGVAAVPPAPAATPTTRPGY